MDKGITVYIRTPDQQYGYFEFVSIPGTIQGDLKAIRETVVVLTQVFQVQTLLGINFEYEDMIQEVARVTLTPIATPISFYRPFTYLLHHFGRPERYLTRWELEGLNVTEHDFLAGLMNMYLYQPIRSVIVKESMKSNQYSAVVIVSEEAFSKVSMFSLNVSRFDTCV